MPTLNAAGLSLIEEFEGCQLTAYQDGGGVWTIGFGHTGGVNSGETITQEEADALLRQDAQSAEIEVQSEVEVQLTPNQFAALVSWQFNTGALRGSPGLALINKREYESAWNDHFCLWIHDVAGNVEPGLVRRRAAEKALFFHE